MHARNWKLCLILSLDETCQHIDRGGTLSRLKIFINYLQKEFGGLYLISMDHKSYANILGENISHIPAFPFPLPLPIKIILYPMVALIAIFATTRDDTLIVVNSAPSFYVALAKVILRKKMVVKYTYSPRHGWTWSIWRHLREILYDAFITMTIRKADGVIVRNDYLKSDIIRRGSKASIEIVPNYINTDLFCPKSEQILENKKRLENCKVIMYAGRLSPIKGIDILINAFAILLKRMDNILLIIIGSGTMRKKLETHCSMLALDDSVIFLGSVPNERLPYYLSYADVFVFPSYGEGQPKSLLEAMSAGRAVIVARGNWLGDLIKDGFNGLLFTPGDSVDLTSKLEYLLQDSSRIKSLGNLAREKILKNYNFKKTIRKKISFLLNVLQENNAS